MKSPYSNDKVEMIRIDYYFDSKKIIFYFLSGQDKKIFTTTAENKGGIKFIASSAELEGFLMSLMIIDSQVIKKINKIAWDYIEGRPVNFPVKLID